MLWRNTSGVRRLPGGRGLARRHSLDPSPALADVDVVDLVGTDGDLGQSLDDVVALQDHIALRGDTRQADRDLVPLGLAG